MTLLSSKKAALVAAPVVFCALGVAVWLWTGPGGGRAARRAAPARFHDRAAEAGLDFRMAFLPGEQGETFKVNLYDHGCGLAVADFDGDGHDDVFFCNQLGPCALYRNRGDGTFEDVTARAGVGLGDRVCVAATFADYDNDGRQDLFVTSTRGGNVLFHNKGDGTFEDVTAKAGVSYVGHSQTAAFFDFDNDGYLDLLLVNTAQWTTDNFDAKARYYTGRDFASLLRGATEANILYRNNGNGTFTDVTARSGLAGRGWAGDVAVWDYDGDGRPDVLVTCMFGRSQLYHNNGDSTFTDVTLATLGRTPFGSVGAKVFDFDNDGRLDLFIVDMHSDMWMDVDNPDRSLPLAREWARKKPRYLGEPADGGDPDAPPNPVGMAREREKGRQMGYDPYEVFYGNGLYRNLGGGKFEEVSDKAGAETFWPWSIGTGDFDNDGYEDAFVAAGMGYPFYYWPNSLLRNNGDGTFTDRAAELGIEPPARGTYLGTQIRGRPCTRSSRCSAVADFDGDGRLDIVTNNFNDQPSYFKNEGPRRNYVAFRLTGTRSNRDAIGAVVRLHVGNETLTRQVHPACGYLSQSSRVLHFGLGDRTAIDRVEITWPGGRTQCVPPPVLNAVHPVTEP
jgi:hypothetical protein